MASEGRAEELGSNGRDPRIVDMGPFSTIDPIVLVLPPEVSKGGSANNAKGHLFERFVATLLHLYGYNAPSKGRLNVTKDGIEIDVKAIHDLTGAPAIVECKAYTSPLSASQLGAFHSKLVTARFEEPETQGYFIALPKLTNGAQERADLIQAHDPKFKALTTPAIVELLRSRNVVVECPIAGLLTSDPAVVVAEEGTFAACLELDPATRLPHRVLAWSASGELPPNVSSLISASEYAQNLPVIDARNPQKPAEIALVQEDPDSVIVTVTGSSSDFEYQLPASPRYFVGRRTLVQDLTEAIEARVGVIVLNAQSGWGKSSAALRLQALTASQGGHSVIVDSRTATSRRFVTDAIRFAAHGAEANGILKLPAETSWASISSALRTLNESEWDGGPLVIFFDQFENVFRDESLTREFRDLAMSAHERSGRVLVGFAWKTDLVGWTESHPYQLRDQIRGTATVLTLGPLGVSEIDTLLRRLEKEIGQSLARDLKTRLREYSQGLPWLFKKLAGHLLREVQGGATQEQLASEALNVQNLFDADLAELSPSEQEALRHIARFAPIAIGEVLERATAPVIESLVNRRLVVQVGERMDTYWDIFRDYLNTGRIPIEDSYILRLGPNSVARLLREVRIDDGDSRVSDIAIRLGTSENGVFNLSRELRLLGATSYEQGRVRVLPEIWSADDPETALRSRIASSLRRHRAYSSFVGMADRLSQVTVTAFAEELASLFPAVDVKEYTWTQYAGAFLRWFEYAGLATTHGTAWVLTADGAPGAGQLLAGPVNRWVKGGGWPQRTAGPSIEFLRQVAGGAEFRATDRSVSRRVRDLVALGAVSLSGENVAFLVVPGLVRDDQIDPGKLRELMERMPGVREGLAVIAASPGASSREVGAAVKVAVGVDWADGTVEMLGKNLRSWAKHAGLSVKRS